MENIIKKQADEMISKYETVKKIKFLQPKNIKILNIKNYDSEILKKEFENLQDDNTIYIISSLKIPFTHDDVKTKFSELKNNHKTYHCSKVNDKIFWEKNDGKNILYVGSKEKKLKERLSQHLGISGEARSVYSLYLRDWWPANVELNIKIYNFSSEVTYELLQILEDLIWDEMHPLFGKKGQTFNKKIVVAK
ncbi:MAG: hypothetical protein OEZ22_08465 [Spirochaetia bacterium]|nr:hypothetical protein [Spirochaetia bacterium]